MLPSTPRQATQPAKAIYDQIDGSADEDIQGDVVAQKAKELNDAVAALQAPASEESKTALQSAITAAKKLKAATTPPAPTRHTKQPSQPQRQS